MQLPTVQQDGQRFGLPVVATEYPAGSGGVKLSLEQMARLIVQGSQSLVMQTMAEKIVRDWARIPANVQVTNAQAAQIFLDYVRATVRYRADPPGSEFMKSAAVTLCAPGTQLCVQVGDCDDLSIALATLCAAYGIPVRILKQMFGSDAQEHVLVAIQDDAGNWLPADPSVPDKPLGWKSPASREDYIDPFDPSTISSLGGYEATFIGVGRAGHWSGTLRPARSVVGLVRSAVGMGALGQPAPPNYQLLSDRTIYHGNRYRIGMLVSTIATPNVPDPGYGYLTVEQRLRNVLGPNWTIEQLTPSGDVTGGIQSWVLQGVATSDQQLTDSAFLTYSVIAAEVPAPSAPPTAPPAESNVGAAKVALIFGAAGLAALWVAPKVLRKPRRRRAA